MKGLSVINSLPVPTCPVIRCLCLSDTLAWPLHVHTESICARTTLVWVPSIRLASARRTFDQRKLRMVKSMAKDRLEG